MNVIVLVGKKRFDKCHWVSKKVLPLGSAQCSKNIAGRPVNTIKEKVKVRSTPMN